jgi:cell division inhibitor SulA
MQAANSIEQRDHDYGVSELLLPSSGNQDESLYMPMLAHLSQKCESRWMTCIGQLLPAKQSVSEFAFNCNKVRCIHADDSQTTLWAFWEALNNGTSDFVVGLFRSDKPKIADDQAMTQLHLAAKNGQSRGLIINLFDSQCQW